ncbi:hypothetical protein [Streptomyces subrutilus]|uniref:hypothetical protein n=1 Tax=Streptomyces subrutilus TaxID=36818 RepID=UPI001FCC690E|nr:hypothetical protein [Streptomyces subrutilus]
MPTEQLLVRTVVAAPHPGDQVPVGRRQLTPAACRGRVPATRLALCGYLAGREAARPDLAAGAAE